MATLPKPCPQPVAFNTPFVFDGHEIRYNVNPANGLGPDAPLSFGQTHPLTFDPATGVLIVDTASVQRLYAPFAELGNVEITQDITVNGDITATGDITGHDVTVNHRLTVHGNAFVDGGITALDATISNAITAQSLTADMGTLGNLQILEGGLNIQNGGALIHGDVNVIDGDVRGVNVTAGEKVSGKEASFETLKAGAAEALILRAPVAILDDIAGKIALFEKIKVTDLIQGNNVNLEGDLGGRTISGNSGDFNQIIGVNAEIIETLNAKKVVAQSAEVQDVTVGGSITVTGDITATNLTALEKVKGATGEFGGLTAQDLSVANDISTASLNASSVQAETGKFSGQLISFSLDTKEVNSETGEFRSLQVISSVTADAVQARLGQYERIETNQLQALEASADLALLKVARVSDSLEVEKLIKAATIEAEQSKISTGDFGFVGTNQLNTQIATISGSLTAENAEIVNASIQNLNVKNGVTASSITTDLLNAKEAITTDLISSVVYTKPEPVQLTQGGNSMIEYFGDLINGTVPTILGFAPTTGDFTIGLVSSGGLGGKPFLPGTTVVIKDVTQQFQPNTSYNVLVTSVGGKIETRDSAGHLSLVKNGTYVLGTTGGSVTFTNVKSKVLDPDVWQIITEVQGNPRLLGSN